MYQAEQPLISCICITRKDPFQIGRAIKCFQDQTYMNKELLIVFETERTIDRPVVTPGGDNGIKHLEIGLRPKKSLGQLRNIGISACGGEYFCQWDDDDWYHIGRLEAQMRAVQSNCKAASVLSNWLMYDCGNEQAYLSYIGPWAGSVLCKRRIGKRTVRYPDLAKNEDAQFANELYSMNCVMPLLMPFLYVYVYHGQNTWDADHFQALFSRSKRLSPSASRTIGKILSGRVSNAHGSRLLGSPGILREIDYFFNWKDI